MEDQQNSPTANGGQSSGAVCYADAIATVKFHIFDGLCSAYPDTEKQREAIFETLFSKSGLWAIKQIIEKIESA